jgi:hypothetical protein
MQKIRWNLNKLPNNTISNFESTFKIITILVVQRPFRQKRVAFIFTIVDPLTMPTDLVHAHQELDKFVDNCYRPLPFSSEAKRMEFLFELYEKYTADLFTKEKVKRTKKKV